MGIDPVAQGLVEHVEALEIIGEAKCWVRDLEQAWTKENETNPTLVRHADAFAVLESDFAAPRPTVWEYVTVPGHRPRWQNSDGVVENAPGRPRGPGPQNHS